MSSSWGWWVVVAAATAAVEARRWTGPPQSGGDCPFAPLHNGSSYIGHNLFHLDLATPALCAQACCNMSDCRAFTHTTHYPWHPGPSFANCTFGGSCCFLKSGPGELEALANCTSGALASPGPEPPSPPAPSNGSCTSARDCHFGGECVAGVCRCDPAWTGPQCAHLHLLPARPHSGYPTLPANGTLPSGSSFPWGGAVVFDPNHTLGYPYHGFFTEYLNHCPMTYDTWSTSTVIRHAVSTNPDGPWTTLDVAVPQAAGNPVVTVAPDGTWLLYFTNHRWGGPVRNCSGPVAGWGPPVYCGKGKGQCATGVSLAYSSSPAGPWTLQYDVLNFSCTNPGAPVFFPNGSLVMAYKSWGGNGRYIGVVSAPSWRHWPYPTRLAGVGEAADLEDPSNLWRDSRGVIHMLFHEAGWGGAAASADGGLTWDYSTPRVAYDYGPVPVEGGGSIACAHREEPKVLLDSSGRPSLLITQCEVLADLPNTKPTPQYPSGERQYLTRIVMQQINTQ